MKYLLLPLPCDQVVSWGCVPFFSFSLGEEITKIPLLTSTLTHANSFILFKRMVNKPCCMVHIYVYIYIFLTHAIDTCNHWRCRPWHAIICITPHYFPKEIRSCFSTAFGCGRDTIPIPVIDGKYSWHGQFHRADLIPSSAPSESTVTFSSGADLVWLCTDQRGGFVLLNCQPFTIVTLCSLQQWAAFHSCYTLWLRPYYSFCVSRRRRPHESIWPFYFFVVK